MKKKMKPNGARACVLPVDAEEAGAEAALLARDGRGEGIEEGTKTFQGEYTRDVTLAEE